MAITLAILISVLCAGSAQAQKEKIVTFNGIEISAGHEEPGEAYGWICYARTGGALPGTLTVTMDYFGVKGPGVSSQVTGGGWTLPVFLTGRFSTAKRPITDDPYRGVLFGSVDGGEITWDKSGTLASVQLKLIIRGGTQDMQALSGSGVLQGTVIYDEKGRGTFSGLIYFDF
jgi:hypothetical protein